MGTITEAGLESESGDKAQVLVAVSIKTTISARTTSRRESGECESRWKSLASETKSQTSLLCHD